MIASRESELHSFFRDQQKKKKKKKEKKERDGTNSVWQ